MKGLLFTAVLIFTVLTASYCKSEVDLLYTRIETLKKELEDNNNIFRREINDAMNSLRFEVERKIDVKVRRGVDSEIRRLQQGHQLMKRELEGMKKTLREVTEEKEVYRNALSKAERRAAESCSKCGIDTKLMKKVLKHCKRLVVNTKSKGITNEENAKLSFVTKRLSSTCKREIEHSSLSLNLSTSTTTTAPLPTLEPIQQLPVMKRLVIANETRSELRQLNLRKNSVSKPYSPRVPDGVSSLAFVQRLGRLLVGTFSRPERITSTGLDDKDTQTLRNGVWTLGMAVDEGRELVFLTTRSPGHSISRMTTRGDNFTVILDMTGGYRNLLSIAVNTREREVYTCSYTFGMFRLNYDGKGLRTLASGDTFGLSFDSESNILYFNAGRTLKKISMSDEVVSDVTTLSVKPFTLTYYNNTVYYGGLGDSRYAGAVYLGEKIVDTPLVRSEYSGSLIVCLVP